MNGRPSRKWLGVSGDMSLMSQLTWVSGLELMRPSHSTSTVEKISLDGLSDPKFNKKTRLMIETRRSHTPPK